MSNLDDDWVNFLSNNELDNNNIMYEDKSYLDSDSDSDIDAELEEELKELEQQDNLNK